MFRLLSAPNLITGQIWLDLLLEAGIDASLERQHLSSIMGEMPPDQCRPEIWLRHPEQEARARQLIADLQRLPQRRWFCRQCGELVEGGFEQCWNCGGPMIWD